MRLHFIPAFLLFAKCGEHYLDSINLKVKDSIDR